MPWLDRPGPTYSWDVPPPKGPFWDDVGWRAATTFSIRYSSEELASLKLDQGLDRMEKLRLLKQLLEQRLAEKERLAAPEPLKVADRKRWHGLVYSIAMMHGFLGEHETAGEIYLQLIVNADGTPNVGALQAVAFELYEQGNFAEAEVHGIKSLAGMRSTLGADSPPGLGMLRQLVKITAKQGKFEAAEAYLEECIALVDGLQGGRFEKYAPEEWEELEETAALLRDTKHNFQS